MHVYNYELHMFIAYTVNVENLVNENAKIPKDMQIAQSGRWDPYFSDEVMGQGARNILIL
jgi:hypothetical protein